MAPYYDHQVVRGRGPNLRAYAGLLQVLVQSITMSATSKF